MPSPLTPPAPRSPRGRSARQLLGGLASLLAVLLIGAWLWPVGAPPVAVDAVPPGATPAMAAPSAPKIAAAGPAAGQAMPNTNVATAAWQQALMRVRQEPLRVLMQRAAVSGHLLDIAAARLAHQRCFAATMLSMRADHRPTTEPKGDTRRARLATAQQTCEGLMDRQPRTLALRDDAGWGALAEPLLRAITSHS